MKLHIKKLPWYLTIHATLSPYASIERYQDEKSRYSIMAKQASQHALGSS